eukprot:CAMPEP_0206234762 /NCGR_PEP_ID=MMETSP0047_2-20121206/12766_1 /ASSEMBLY_ACC=CAM_ASM_000192 /TAXON_ID=195065 /ORGANISM="Chroomonas mesostigmatica_cf, Strain CCMP1168" /LENGTH=128 /DNA_ID=CAMNT_0053658875 /DNA_START=219 /DNA_END=602 /DNA_ORIENTATION=-
MRRCVGFTFEGTPKGGEQVAAEDAPRPPYRVTEVCAGTEAEEKVAQGDEIVSIDGCPVECLRITSVRTLLSGPALSTLELRLRRRGGVVPVSLVRHSSTAAVTGPMSPSDSHSAPPSRSAAGDMGPIS